jgi:hypothetical protein
VERPAAETATGFKNEIWLAGPFWAAAAAAIDCVPRLVDGFKQSPIFPEKANWLGKEESCL